MHASSEKVTAVSEGERRKIVGKLLPHVRAGTAIDFAVFGRHLKPPRSATVVRKIRDDFVSGSPWNRWGRRRDPRHEPIRVYRQLQDLRAAEPDISLRETARRLCIPWGTFQGINGQVKQIPASELVFSRGNTSFRRKYLLHVRLATLRLRASLFVLTDIEVVGAFITLAKDGVLVELHLDRQCMLSPFAAPRIKELLAAGVHVFAQKEAGQSPQHQKMIIVDDVVCSTGSVNPSKRGLDWSIENITFHFLAPEIDKAIREFTSEQTEDFSEIDADWLAAELEAASLKQQVAAALVSEGLDGDDESALAAWLASAGQDAAEAAAMKAFLAAEGKDTVREERREAYKADYQASKAADKCPRCRQRLPDSCSAVLCPTCRAQGSLKYAEMKQQHKCPTCNRAIDPMDLHVHCAACRAKAAAKRRLRTVSPGTCHSCTRPRALKPGTGGLYECCERCRDQQKRYNEATRERHKVKAKMHYQANAEQINAKARAKYAADAGVRAKCRVSMKRYYEEHAEEQRAKKKLYYAANAARISAAQRAKREEEEAQLAQDDLVRMGLTEAELLAGEKTAVF